MVKVLDGRVAIADGKYRKLLKPKLKNPLHLAPTNKYVVLENATDRQLRKELAAFREKSQEGGS